MSCKALSELLLAMQQTRPLAASPAHCLPAGLPHPALLSALRQWQQLHSAHKGWASGQQVARYLPSAPVRRAHCPSLAAVAPTPTASPHPTCGALEAVTLAQPLSQKPEANRQRLDMLPVACSGKTVLRGAVVQLPVKTSCTSTQEKLSVPANLWAFSRKHRQVSERFGATL